MNPVEAARRKVKEAIELDSNQDFFKETLNSAINERTGYNQDLIAEQNRLMNEQMSLPAQLREQYSTSAIVDPFAQERIISNRRGTIQQNLGTITDMLAARGQRFSDILGRATSGFAERAGRAGRLAEMDLQAALQDRELAERRRAAAEANALQRAALAMQERQYNDAVAQQNELEVVNNRPAPIDPNQERLKALSKSFEEQGYSPEAAMYRAEEALAAGGNDARTGSLYNAFRYSQSVNPIYLIPSLIANRKDLSKQWDEGDRSFKSLYKTAIGIR